MSYYECFPPLPLMMKWPYTLLLKRIVQLSVFPNLISIALTWAHLTQKASSYNQSLSCAEMCWDSPHQHRQTADQTMAWWTIGKEAIIKKKPKTRGELSKQRQKQLCSILRAAYVSCKRLTPSTRARNESLSISLTLTTFQLQRLYCTWVTGGFENALIKNTRRAKEHTSAVSNRCVLPT